MGLPPRAVVVTRETELDALLGAHSTIAAVRFFLEGQGRSTAQVEERHAIQRGALESVLTQIPLDWRRARVERGDLDRFLFTPEDVVLTVGQDGLVANVAKYLDGQPVIGVNPGLFDGVLAPHAPARVRELMLAVVAGELHPEARTLVEASSYGQRLLALNEIFVGHRAHQSARYLIEVRGHRERHSSSGLIVSTGTGASGWARSICRVRETAPELPGPTDAALAFLVREAWPSGETFTELTDGLLGHDDELVIESEMNAGGVVFGDGLEADFLPLDFGREVRLRVAERALQLCL